MNIPPDLLKFLRYCRTFPAHTLRDLLRRRKRECTWCGSKIRNRNLYYCSDDCRQNTYGHCSPKQWAPVLFERDRGRCVLCGIDATLNGEIDHIVPVCEGGGFCGPENLRTLCPRCHRQETEKLNTRLKRQGAI